ncbi:hypothetical protein [Fontibacillus sp. BL9]|uniref:hypothetical protein n=1 Tax=Fontibacillus sp. BL9 TaxID=3389971 RepID=UPI003978BFC8
MKYLNVSLEPLDHTHEVYFYGEILTVQYTLISPPLTNNYKRLYRNTNEAMQKFLLKQAAEQIHINLFVKHIDLMTIGAIRGFLEMAAGKKENHLPSKRRLMVWVTNLGEKDCRAFGYYEG